MEEWNDGMAGVSLVGVRASSSVLVQARTPARQKRANIFPIIPLFPHSLIPETLT